MSNETNAGAGGNYWGRDGLGQSILDALAAAGKDLDALTIDDLAPMDHFHGGGKPSTTRLAPNSPVWRRISAYWTWEAASEDRRVRWRLSSAATSP